MQLARVLPMLHSLALVASCQAAPGPASGLERMADKVVTETARASRLTITIRQADEPARGYGVKYVRVLDWERAVATLTNPTDVTVPAVNQTIDATVSATNARTATI